VVKNPVGEGLSNDICHNGARTGVKSVANRGGS
jgi:hypothetical protein